MNSYRDIIKDYEEKINKLQKGKSDTSKESPQGIEKINESIIEIKKSIESTELEMTKLKNTSLMNVQNGTTIISIVPEENQSFNVEIYIPNENFGEIKENQEVRINRVFVFKGDF